MDIVIPYRQTYSDELKYTLRSLKNFKHDNVFIIGDRPNFKVNHIPYRQTGQPSVNTLNILNIATNSPDISEDFVWLADDMYFLQRVQKLPIYHRGKYKDVIEDIKTNGIHSVYLERMMKTENKLLQLGINEPKCYEVHTPFVFNKTKLQAITALLTPNINKISIYANYYQLGGTKIKDVKINHQNILPKGKFTSTHDATFNTVEVGKYLQDLFPEPSEYEL